MNKIIINFFLISFLSMTVTLQAVENSNTDNKKAVISDTSVYEEQMNDLDPLEPLNRIVFEVNTFLDGLLIRPMAYAYEDFFPDMAKERLSNFVDNLSSPIVFANDVLQGEGKKAFNTLARLLINTTFGILGLFDPASEIGFDQRKNDFGTTFRRWGIGAGPYIMLPLFGPSSIRDIAGDITGYYTDPYNWYMRVHYKKKWLGRKAGRQIYSMVAVKSLIKRYKYLNITEDIDKTEDPYAQYRILYMQHRKIIDAIEESAVPDDMIDADSDYDAEEVKF